MAKCYDNVVAVVDSTHLNPHVWVVGILLAFAGNLFSVAGLLLQRYAATRNEKLAASEQRSRGCQPLNLVGVAFLFITAALDLAAYAFAPQSLLSPMGAVTLVMNMLAAPIFLKEPLGRKDIIATLLVFSGVACAIIFGDRKSASYAYKDLLCLFTRPAFIIYASIMGFLVLCMLVFVFVVSRSKESTQAKFYKVYRICFPALAGIFGGGSTLFGKSSVELVANAVHGGDAFTHVVTYFIVGFLIFCAVLQLRTLNMSLAKFESLFVVPIYQIFLVLVGVMGGSVYFDEVKNFTPLQWSMYSFGVTLSLIGVGLLSTRKPQETVTPTDPDSAPKMMKSINEEEAALLRQGERMPKTGPTAK